MAKKTQTAESTDFESKSTTTLRNITDAEGKVYNEIKYAWQFDSEAKKLADDTTAEYKWDADDWAKVGVYAEKDKDAKYRYIFKGWSTNPDDKDPAELTTDDIDVRVNTDGKLIIDTVKIKDNDIANCPGNVKHYEVLYAVWEKEPIPATHTYSVRFNLNTGSYYKYYDGTQWRTSSSSSYSTYTSDELVVADSKTYEFPLAYWKEASRTNSATKNNSNTNSFDFAGWSYGREGKAASALTEEDVDITIDEEGFIKDKIEGKCEDDSCEGGNHIINLYAVWTPKPLTKTYTINFDLNTKSGEAGQAGNCPDPLTWSEVYGETTPGAWVNSHTFALPDNSDPSNLPTYKSMTFVGWSTNKNAMPGEYGYAYGNPELLDTTRNLRNNYTLSTTSTNSNPVSVTLYAIWAYEYQMTYDANDGSSAPSMEHEYTNQARHNYTLSENYPTRNGYKFLGWADSKDATEPQYYPNNSAFGNDKPKVKVVDADPSGSTKIRLYAVWQED